MSLSIETSEAREILLKRKGRIQESSQVFWKCFRRKKKIWITDFQTRVQIKAYYFGKKALKNPLFVKYWFDLYSLSKKMRVRDRLWFSFGFGFEEVQRRTWDAIQVKKYISTKLTFSNENILPEKKTLEFVSFNSLRPSCSYLLPNKLNWEKIHSE